MISVVHHRVNRYCDLPEAVKLDGRVWRFESLCFGSRRVGYATLGSLLLKTVDGGQTWRYLGRLPPTGFGVRKIFCFGSMRSWVACASTTGARRGPIPVLITEDGGKHWNAVWVGDPSAEYGSKIGLFFVDERTGWLAVTRQTDQGTCSAIFGTTDSGAHWRLMGEYHDVRLQAILFRTVDEGYLLASTPQQDRNRAFTVDLQNGSTKSQFLVGGNASVLLSVIGPGAKAEPIVKTKSSLYTINATASGTILMCGSGGTILRGSKSESTWKRVKTGTRSDLNDIGCADSETGTAALAVGEDGVILQSTDEGKTWLRVQHEMGACGFSAVEMLSNSNAIVAANDAIYLLDLSKAPNVAVKHPEGMVRQ